MRYFEFDTLQEIIATMRANKLRTFLTGFAVAWGIFILIVLQGSGNGLRNGVTSNFSELATNMVNVWPGETNIPYKGYKSKRKLAFTTRELELLKTQFPSIDKISGNIRRWGVAVKNGKESGNYNLEGVMPDYLEINRFRIEPGNGRFLNEIDMLRKRKVVVVNKKVMDELFKNRNAIGQWLIIDNVSFEVVGIDTKKSRDENGRCYIPHSTAQELYRFGDKVGDLFLTVNGLKTRDENADFGEQLKNTLARLLIVHPDDTQAIGIWNQASDYVQTMNVFSTIDLFVFFVGLCTLMAGIVGVSNIMVVTVRERTREFGIKKALGATPISVLLSILLESVVITTVFGYVGIVLGTGFLEAVNVILTNNTKSGTHTFMVFKDPSVDLRTVFLATGVLIFSGLIAGFFPARRAVKIRPIEAMRTE